MCTKDIRTLEAAFVPQNSNDTFFMEHVSIETINRSVHYISMLTPLLKIFGARKFDIDLIHEGEQALNRLTMLMKKSYDGTRTLEKGVYSKQVQSAFRELGIMDLCIKYIYMFIIYDVGEF